METNRLDSSSPRLPSPSTLFFTRWTVVSVTTVMAVLLYLDRTCVAILQNYLADDLRLTETQIGWFLSAFFWSYALAQVPSGWLSDRFGLRVMLTVYIVIWSAVTGLLGLAQSFWGLLILRLVCGLGQAGAYPTAAALLRAWMEPTQRGIASSCVALGGRFGGAVAPILTVTLLIILLPWAISSDSDQLLIKDAHRFAAAWDDSERENHPEREGLWRKFSPELQKILTTGIATGAQFQEAELQSLFKEAHLFPVTIKDHVRLPAEAHRLWERKLESQGLTAAETVRLNRLTFEALFPDSVYRLYGTSWRLVLMVYGLLGLLVAGAVWWLVRDTPAQHPWTKGISTAEEAPAVAAPPPFPWKTILTAPSLWGACGAQFLTNVGWVFVVTSLPRYLETVHQTPLVELGWMASAPMAVGVIGMILGGRWTDWATKKYGLKWGRRLPMVSTKLLGAAGYLACAILPIFYPPASAPVWMPWVYIGCICLVTISTDLGVAATWAFSQDVGGRYTGAILGWSNMWGNLGAAVAPPLYAFILWTPDGLPGLGQWNTVFYVLAGVLIVSGLCGFLVDASKPIIHDDVPASP